MGFNSAFKGLTVLFRLCFTTYDKQKGGVYVQDPHKCNECLDGLWNKLLNSGILS